jgi:hypothetical protein
MEIQNRSLIKTAFALLAALVLVFILRAAYLYFTSGSITVTTSNGANYVKIELVASEKNDHKTLFSKQAPGRVSARVRPGNYEISVSGQKGYQSTSKIVSISHREHKEYSLELSALIDPEPVYGSDAENPVADISHLYFIDFGSGGDQASGILSSGSASGVSQSAINNHFSRVAWAYPGYGVAQNRDGSDYSLYLVNGSAASVIGLPPGVVANKNLIGTVSHSGKIYVSDGRAVYLQNGGSYKKIYTNRSDVLIGFLVAGDDGVLAIQNNVEALEEQRNGSQPVGFVLLINDDGASIKKSMSAVNAAWSPDNQHFLVEEPLSAEIFDSNFHKVGQISVNNAAHFTWLTNRFLLFAENSQLWQYDRQDSSSRQLTTLPNGVNITNISPDATNDYVYFNTDNGEKKQLFRVGLKNQVQHKSFGALSVFLPEVKDFCNLNFINLQAPVIMVGYPSTQDSSRCIGVAKNELSTYGLNPADFNYQLVPEDIPQT